MDTYSQIGIVQRAIRLCWSHRRRKTGTSVKMTNGGVTNASKTWEARIGK